MKKKYVLKNRKRFITLLSAFVLLTVIAAAAANVYSQENVKYETVVVKKGDTIWSIAEESCNNTDIRLLVDTIRKINRLDGCIIYEGSELLIPIN